MTPRRLLQASLALAAATTLTGCALLGGGSTSERTLRTDLEESTGAAALGTPTAAYTSGSCLDVCSELTLTYDRPGVSGVELCREVVGLLASRDAQLTPAGGALTSVEECEKRPAGGRFDADGADPSGITAYRRSGSPAGEFTPFVSWRDGVVEVRTEG